MSQAENDEARRVSMGFADPFPFVVFDEDIDQLRRMELAAHLFTCVIAKANNDAWTEAGYDAS
jgi:hypothetical protein